MMADGIRQCVLFLTDSTAPRIVRHFDRLADQAPFQTSLCVWDRIESDRGHIRLDYQAAGARFRFRRPARPSHKTRPFLPGTVDLLWLEAIAAVSQRHAYDFYWIVEYDVDFSGHWSRFFNAFVDEGADLIGTQIIPRQNCEHSMWWRHFNPPPEVTGEHHIKAFLPVVRLSSRLVARLRDIYDHTPCIGHQEVMLPSLCSYFGLALADIGRRKRWFGRGEKWTGEGRTFTADWTGMPISYFHEDPSAFAQPNVLWHPVKVSGSPIDDRRGPVKQS